MWLTMFALGFGFGAVTGLGMYLAFNKRRSN
jgi:cytochrome bd-type quinol oxidase subunit 1